MHRCNGKVSKVNNGRRTGSPATDVEQPRLFQDNVGSPPWMPVVMAFPLPRRYAPRSQAISLPCGSGLGRHVSWLVTMGAPGFLIASTATP